VADRRLHVEGTISTVHDDLLAGFDVIGPSLDDLATADAALVGGRIWDAAMMDRAPKLRVLARTGIGIDNVDLAAATARGILVTNTPDGPTVSTAEHAIALILAVAKRVAVCQRRLRDAEGDYHRRHEAVELAGCTLGLLGVGRIGRRVAAFGQALGMEVIATDPYVDTSDVAPVDVALVDLPELLARSDVLSLHAPLTDETRHQIDAAAFAQMRPGALLVNCARGGLVDHDALVAALESGRLGGAGLDCTEPEPLPPEHPLLHRDDVIVTPHVASATDAGRLRMLEMAIEQVTMALDGQRPTHLCNPEAWAEP
jgi:phosphoglycerate dehydrogenase-like enzyme